jgi:hypothetical protein
MKPTRTFLNIKFAKYGEPKPSVPEGYDVQIWRWSWVATCPAGRRYVIEQGTGALWWIKNWNEKMQPAAMEIERMETT